MECVLTEDPLLSADNLSIAVKGEKIIHSLSLDVGRGMITALIGESGAGKTMLLKAIMGILPGSAEISHGSILYSSKDILRLSRRDRERLRGCEIAMVPQNPISSFNPVYRISHHFRLLSKKGSEDYMDSIYGMLGELSVPDAGRVMDSYPHELSGGTLQRLSFAAALSLNPRLLLLDEPMSALDATAGSLLLDYIIRYRESHDITVLMVTHDLGWAADADDVAVMHSGAIVERAEAYEFFRNPCHPYSIRLLEASRHGSYSYGSSEKSSEGFCPFYYECEYNTIECKELLPEMHMCSPQHYVSCHNSVDKNCN